MKKGAEDTIDHWEKETEEPVDHGEKEDSGDAMTGFTEKVVISENKLKY